MKTIDKIDKYLKETMYSSQLTHQLSTRIKDKDFMNIYVANKPSRHRMMGQDPKVLYVDLEPHNREITPQYENMLLKKLRDKKDEIFKEYNKSIIIVNDIIKIE